MHAEMQSLSRMATLPVHQKFNSPMGRKTGQERLKNDPSKLHAGSLCGVATQRGRYLQSLHSHQPPEAMTKRIQALISCPPSMASNHCDNPLMNDGEIYQQISPPGSVSASASTLASPSTNSSSVRGWSQDSISLSGHLPLTKGPYPPQPAMYQRRQGQGRGKKSNGRINGFDAVSHHLSNGALKGPVFNGDVEFQMRGGCHGVA